MKSHSTSGFSIGRAALVGRALRVALVAATVAVILSTGPVGAQGSGTVPQAGAAPAGAGDRPSDEMLRAVESDGHRIASYHEAIAKARDRAREKNGDLLDGTRMVVVNRSGTWHVVFLRQTVIAGVQKGLMAVADAVFQPRAGDLSAFQAFDPPRVSPSDAQAAMRAGEGSRTRAQQGMPGGTTFDEAVLRDGPGPWTVYLQRHPTAPGSFLIGGDFTATVGPDGTQVTDFKPIHDKSVDVSVALSKSGSPTLHMHPTGDLPTATDVAMVVEHPTLAPHLVLTPRWMFRIEEGGTITFLGPNSVPPVAAGGGH
ncbi:MAG TPA: hypothetical protein VFB49_11145 [Patescibacteria group bacterium]|nr:hypothetical protein [Patescibacteria group bacterium]